MPIDPNGPVVQCPRIDWCPVHHLDRPGAGGTLSIKRVAEEHHVAQVGCVELIPDILYDASRALRRNELDAEVSGIRVRGVDSDLYGLDSLHGWGVRDV